MTERVPKEVQEAIRKAADYRAKAREYESVIEAWLEKKGVQDDDGFRDVIVDCIEHGYDPENAIEMFEIMLP